MISHHLKWKVAVALLMAAAPLAGQGQEQRGQLQAVSANESSLFFDDTLHPLVAEHVGTINTAAASVHTVPPSDAYVEGYLQGLVDAHYPEAKVRVSVVDRQITLKNLPADRSYADVIVAFVSEAPGVIPLSDPKVKGPTTTLKMQEPTARKRLKRENGVWFPDQDRLFYPLIADPRQPSTSLGWRYGDEALSKHVGAVSIGEEIPIFRWIDVPKWHGDMQLGIEGGIWSVFDLDSPSMDLMNTDFKLGILLTYAKDETSYRLALNHISCHLGDEFIVEHPSITRLNPSMEMLEFAISHYFIPPLRLYADLGYIIASDKSFPMDKWFANYGFELRLFGHRDLYNRIMYQPFLACNLANWQKWDWNFEVNTMLGIEVGKLDGKGRKVRLYLEYYDGHSQEGQFSVTETSFFSINLAYGF